MSCDRLAQLQAYYDGELPPSELAVVRAHVAGCAVCRAELDSLKRISELVASAPLAELSPAAMARLERTWTGVRERGVMRIAGWLTAAAAAVMVGTVLIQPIDRTEAGRSVVWQTTAVMPPAETYDSSGELVTIAQWMANDLSPEQEELPR